ncbi:MAG: hypothetical protein Aurels2KO_56680 [Aureliella sp.]
MFNKLQKSELMRLAGNILELEKWDALPWSDAWNGAYPLRATKAETITEAVALECKAARIITRESLEGEYSSSREYMRMITLESAETFNLYDFNRDS